MRAPKRSPVEAISDQGETGSLHPDPMCMFAIFGQVSCPEVVPNFVCPFCAFFLSIVDRCVCDRESGLEVDGQQYCFFHEKCSSYSC